MIVGILRYGKYKGRWFKIPRYIVKTDVQGHQAIIRASNKKIAKQRLKKLFNISSSEKFKIRSIFEFGNFISLEEDNDANI